MATIQKTDTDAFFATESESIPNIVPKDDTDSITFTEVEAKYVLTDETTWDSPIMVTITNPFITVQFVTNDESLIDL